MFPRAARTDCRVEGNAPAGPPIRVSQEGGRWPNWTGAGRKVVFMTPDGRVQEVEQGLELLTRRQHVEAEVGSHGAAAEPGLAWNDRHLGSALRSCIEDRGDSARCEEPDR